MYVKVCVLFNYKIIYLKESFIDIYLRKIFIM